MWSIGIDPGLDGYVALVDGHNVLAAHQVPTIQVGKKGRKREYDPVMMRKILQGSMLAAPDPDALIVVLEKQQAMPGQGVTSTFRTGHGFGLWTGLIVGLGMRHMIVHPRTWQKRMHRDVRGDDTKGRSILACQRLYPHHSLLRTPRCSKPDNNMADAILLATYGCLEWEGVT